MGRRMRKPRKRFRPKFPNQRTQQAYPCVICGKPTLLVTIDRKTETASIKCKTCPTEDKFELTECFGQASETIDVFCRHIDRVEIARIQSLKPKPLPEPQGEPMPVELLRH